MRIFLTIFMTFIFVTPFAQKTKAVTVSGILLLEELQGHVYAGYFLPGFSSHKFREFSAGDTVSGLSVSFIFGCVPDNDGLRYELRKRKLLDSTQGISVFSGPQGQDFPDSAMFFFMNGAFEKNNLTDYGKIIRYQRFELNGKAFVVALKGECTTRTFLYSKGRVSS